MVNFGLILKSLRIRDDMSQAQLAQKLGLTKSVISALKPAHDSHLMMCSYILPVFLM